MVDNEKLSDIKDLELHLEITRKMLFEKGSNISISNNNESTLDKMENSM